MDGLQGKSHSQKANISPQSSSSTSFRSNWALRPKMKGRVSDKFGIMLCLPVNIALLPGVPPVLVKQYGSWMGKYLKKLNIPLRERDSIIHETSPTLSNTLHEAKICLEVFQSRQLKVKCGKDNDGNDIMVPLMELLGRTCARIDQYVTIVDTMIQHQPFITALVWGSFKLLLKIAGSDAETISKLASLIDDYIEMSQIFDMYWKKYNHSYAASAQRVLDILKALEEDLKALTHAARRYFYMKHALVRITKAVVTPFDIEFQPICEGIKDRAIRLRDAINAAEQDERQRLDILNWLSNVPYRDLHIRACEKKSLNTCGWLFDKEAFKAWEKTENSSMLWVHGNAGVGKTILMSNMVEHLTNQGAHTEYSSHVAYFYCSQDKPATLEAVTILATILKQLIFRFPELPDKIVSSYKGPKYQGLTQSRHRLANICSWLHEVLKICNAMSKPVFVLIDGFDECGKDARADVISALECTVEPSPSSRSPAKDSDLPLAKIVIFTREQNDIGIGPFHTCRRNFYQISIQAKDTTPDITTFLSEKLERSKLVEAEDLKMNVVRQLASHANGLFLWINIQQEWICKERDVSSIEKYLKELPNSDDMSACYDRMIHKISLEAPGNKCLAEEALAWVFYANRILSVEELGDALRFSQASTKNDNLELARDIISVCQGLLEIYTDGDSSYFRFVHFSAKEYVARILGAGLGTGLGNHIQYPYLSISSQKTSRTNSNITLDPVIYMPRLAALCVRYLCQEHFNRGPWVAESLHGCSHEYESFLRAHPFLGYAAASWITYLNRSASDMDSDLFRLVEGFFRLPFHLGLAFQVYWFQSHVDEFPLGSTPFHIACYFGIVKFLRQNDRKMSSQDHKKRTPLYWAARNGHSHVLAELKLIEGAQYIEDDLSRETQGHMINRVPRIPRMVKEKLMAEALIAASEGDQIEVVQKLLSAGANPNFQVGKDQGKDALFIASANGNLETVRLLLNAGAKVEMDRPYGTPLIAAVEGGAVNVVQHLLDVGANVNAKTPDGIGALHAAMIAGNCDMVQLLLTEGADITIFNDLEGSIDALAIMGDQKIVELFLEEAERRGMQIGHLHGAVDSISSEEETSDRCDSTANAAISNTPERRRLSTLSEKGLKILMHTALEMSKKVASGKLPLAIAQSKIIPRALKFLERTFTDEGTVETLIQHITPLLDDFMQSCEITPAMYLFLYQMKKELTIYVALNQTRYEESVGERIKAMAGLVCTMGFDAGLDEHFRRYCADSKADVIKIVTGGTQDDAENALAARALDMDFGVLTIGTGLVLRGAVMEYIAGLSAMEKINPHRAHALLEAYLADINTIALDARRNGPEKRKLVTVIEMGHAAYVYGHQKIEGKIRLTLMGLLSAVKKKLESEVDPWMKGQVQDVLRRANPRWKWDDEEMPWWAKYTDFNMYASWRYTDIRYTGGS